MPKRHRTDTQPTHAEPEKRSLLESSIGVLAATGIFVVAVVAGRMLWDQIVVPYSNPWNIAGVLAQEHFNPKTNTHRFLSFPRYCCWSPTLFFAPGQGESSFRASKSMTKLSLLNPESER